MALGNTIRLTRRSWTSQRSTPIAGTTGLSSILILCLAAFPAIVQSQAVESTLSQKDQLAALVQDYNEAADAFRVVQAQRQAHLETRPDDSHVVPGMLGIGAVGIGVSGSVLRFVALPHEVAMSISAADIDEAFQGLDEFVRTGSLDRLTEVITTRFVLPHVGSAKDGADWWHSMMDRRARRQAEFDKRLEDLNSLFTDQASALSQARLALDALYFKVHGKRRGPGIGHEPSPGTPSAAGPENWGSNAFDFRPSNSTEPPAEPNVWLPPMGPVGVGGGSGGGGSVTDHLPEVQMILD